MTSWSFARSSCSACRLEPPVNFTTMKRPGRTADSILPVAAESAVTAPAPAAPDELTISDIESRSGLPLSTIRYYEKEFAGFIKPRKTLGGHRRYAESDLQKFLYVKELIQDKKLSLKKVRQALVSENEPQVLRRDLDLLIEVYHQITEENERLKRGMQELALRLARLEAGQPRARKSFRFFGENK
jgi:DNA-binding transcriptional MerR regulator